MASIFLGYPQLPRPIAEVMRTTALALRGEHDCITWESLAVGGRVVIRRVLQAIDDSDLGIFDMTRPSENVLFEAGYALARAKPIWLTLDSTVSSAKKDWNDLGLLKLIGYETYRNSEELRDRIRYEDPAARVPPLYDSLIEPAMPDVTSSATLLYGPPFEPFEAANRLTSLVESHRRRGLQVVSADPTESSLEPLTWYAEKLGNAGGVLINFAGQLRNLATVHNRRNAFVAGMTVGLEIPLLMLAEDDYAAPFDYEHLLKVYDTAARCLGSARPWLAGLGMRAPRITARPVITSSRLAGLRFGEHVAENELADLEDYFVRTAAFEDVLRARDTLFVGHRGTGKTANALRAYEEIADNKENLVLLIKPASFEFPGLLASVNRLPPHTHDYLFDTMWRFLIQTELAALVVDRIESRPGYVPRSSGEDDFLSYIDRTPFDVRADMSVRLDQALTHLTRGTASESSVETGRVLINEAFHHEALAQLRHFLGPILKDHKRVAVLIDNLDKGWQREARLDVLARLILGLLSARGHLVTDFQKQDWWRDKVRLTMAIFLRSDIFTYVKNTAREPDKLSISTIVWRDTETLEAVLEERLQSGWTRPGKAPDMWGGIFTAVTGGQSTRDFVMQRVLPRPRDIVYWANAAIARAIDRRKDQVTEAEVLSALSAYSQYAYEALLVENGITIPELEAVLYGFLGESSTVSRRRVFEVFTGAGVAPDKHESTLNRLFEMSFLGLETNADQFAYPEVGSDLGRALELAKRHQPTADSCRYEIHPAFHDFLQIEPGRHAIGDSFVIARACMLLFRSFPSLRPSASVLA